MEERMLSVKVEIILYLSVQTALHYLVSSVHGRFCNNTIAIIKRLPVRIRPKSKNVCGLHLGQITFVEQKKRDEPALAKRAKKLTFKWSFSYLTNSALIYSVGDGAGVTLITIMS